MPNNEFLQGIAPVSFICTADLSAYNNRFVLISTAASREIALCGAGGQANGIMVYGSKAGKAAPVQCLGAPFVEFGATVIRGYVKSDAQGRAIQASPIDVTNGLAVGFVWDGGAIGERGACQLVTPNTP